MLIPKSVVINYSVFNVDLQSVKTLQIAYQLPDYTNYQIELTLQDGTQLEFENDD